VLVQADIGEVLRSIEVHSAGVKQACHCGSCEMGPTAEHEDIEDTSIPDVGRLRMCMIVEAVEVDSVDRMGTDSPGTGMSSRAH
jgi:hypothetical protein